MSGDIAILMTCHNRRDKTTLCLKALQRQDLPERTRLVVYVVDDGSSDGTSDAIKSIFPSARLMRGDGSLFWCGGMRRAWQEAAKSDCQHYLWINDDTFLFDFAVADLLGTLEYVRHQRGQDAIVVGAIRSPDSETATYGGVMQVKKRGSLGFNIMSPRGQPAECDTMNGNIVLVPRTIADVVGNLSPQFTHGMGDFDYGLRAKEKEYSCWMTAKYVGTCRRNASGGAWHDPRLAVTERLRRLYSPLGLPPTEYATFLWRHGGYVAAAVGFTKVHLRAVFPKTWNDLSARSGSRVIHSSCSSGGSFGTQP